METLNDIAPAAPAAPTVLIQPRYRPRRFGVDRIVSREQDGVTYLQAEQPLAAYTHRLLDRHPLGHRKQWSSPIACGVPTSSRCASPCRC